MLSVGLWCSNSSHGSASSPGRRLCQGTVQSLTGVLTLQANCEPEFKATGYLVDV